jgi:4-amino-4-deoxy-L-arabinose transferase-like glycosyltransferase
MANTRKFLKTNLFSHKVSSTKQIGWDCFLVGLFCLILFSFQLGNRPFATPDEARYVEVPREMVVSGDWVTPRLNGVKYFEKPPLLYWLQACSFKIFGPNEAGMRLWLVILATIGCIGTYAFGRSVFDRATGFIAAGVLATTALYFSLSRLIILDMGVSVWVTLAMFCFYQGFQNPTSLQRRLWFYGFSALCGLGVLTKGIMALAIPGPLIILWLIYTKSWKQLFPLYFLSSLFVFLAITAPWHILVSLNNPDFAYKYFIIEHFLRFTTTMHARYQPIWFFIPVILGGLLPWTIFLKSAWLNFWQNRQDKLYSFLWFWIGWVTLFFSASNSKLIPYILPIFPPLALVVAHRIRQLFVESFSAQTLYEHSVLCGTLGAAGLILPTYFPDLLDGKLSLLPYIYVLSGLFLTHSLLTFFLAKQNCFKKALANIGVTAVIMTVILGAAAPHVQRPSLKNLVNTVLQHQKANEPIISFLTYNQDLPLYSQQRVMVVGAKGELEYGSTVEDTSSWTLSEEAFLKLWQQAQKQGKKIWAIGRLYDLERFKKQYPHFTYQEVAQDFPNVLFVP